MIKALYLSVVLVATSACNQFDPYLQKFQQISIGDSRSRTVELLGPATTVNALELPLIRLEQLVWRSPANGRVYLIHVVLDRVAAKTIIQ